MAARDTCWRLSPFGMPGCYEPKLSLHLPCDAEQLRFPLLDLTGHIGRPLACGTISLASDCSSSARPVKRATWSKGSSFSIARAVPVCRAFHALFARFRRWQCRAFRHSFCQWLCRFLRRWQCQRFFAFFADGNAALFADSNPALFPSSSASIDEFARSYRFARLSPAEQAFCFNQRL